MRQRMRTGLLVGLLLAAAACGDDDDADRAGTSAAIESTVTGSTTATTGAPAAVGQQLPAAIVSLSPTATEMLFAIGAGDQVLAVDDFSNYPPEASAKMPGISGYEPNIEAIAGLEPDLVITDGTNTEVLAQFDTLGIDHWERSEEHV